ncbi:nucleotidyltransferase/DNA polymerase involved in DNA repair [Bradyrhizobium sp. USDA 3397]
MGACDAKGYLALPAVLAERSVKRMSPGIAARDKPLVTATMEGQRRILAAADEAARRAGLSVGMTVTHAQTLLPDLCVVNATPCRL